MNRQGSGFLLDILVGIVGAVVAGWLFDLLGSGGLSGLNWYRLLVAVSGALVVLLVYHLIRHGQSDAVQRCQSHQLD